MRATATCFTTCIFLLSHWGLAGDPDSHQLSKLPDRVLWTTSRVIGFPDAPPPYKAEPAYPNLTFNKPLGVGRFPAGDLLWVLTHTDDAKLASSVRMFRDMPDVSETQVAFDLPEHIYGIAFHPRFADNGYMFVGCNGDSDALGKKATKVLRFMLEREPPFRVDPDSRQLIIEWASDGHNGADLAFGNDGMLYVSAGDGTSDSDPDLAGQDMTVLTGKMIRIDVDHAVGERPYSIPPDNPFLEIPNARPEIWALGLRNPWKVSFDPITNQLWVGNNGQDLWETAHLIRRGENYGWSVMEGSHVFQIERPRGPTPFVDPTVEHHHSEARSLTGGVVYHGDVLPQLDGYYIYGDYSTGNIWGVKHDGEKVVDHQFLARTPLQITGFGMNTRGDLLIVDHGGDLYRLTPRPPQEDAPPFPRRLSETGIFTSVKDHEVHPGLIPYSVNSPLWSDGADKQRFLGLPDDAKIEFFPSTGFDLPSGSVLVKSFWLGTRSETDASARLIETRLITKQGTEWFGYTYEWNDEQTDAVLVEAAGKDREFVVHDADSGSTRNQSWHYPSRSECLVCHSRAAKFVLGLNVPQMNRDHNYGGVTVNQLAALEKWGLLRNPKPADRKLAAAEGPPVAIKLPKPPEELARLADPYDSSQPLQDRVRSYLHSNCANCHVEAGGGNSLMDLAFDEPLDKMRVIDITPQHDRLGIDDARIIAPGDPDRSILLARITRRGRGQMPPLATSRIDEPAAALIREWILRLEVGSSNNGN